MVLSHQNLIPERLTSDGLDGIVTRAENRWPFDDFCRRMYPRLVGSLGLYTGDTYLAEELAQETLARVWRDRRKVAQMDHPEAWTHKVAFNLARSHFRRKAVEVRASRRMSREEIHHDPDIAEMESMRSLMSTLSARQRQSLILRYYLGYSYREISSAMDAPEPTVRSHVRRALERLRLESEPHLLEESRDVT